MAQTLGVGYSELPIEPVFGRFMDTLANEFSTLPQRNPQDTTG